MSGSRLQGIAFVALLVLSACGQQEQAAPAPAPASETPAATAQAIEADASPKFIGAPNGQWQTAGDAVQDDERVRDVTFSADGSGATVEVMVRPTDDQLRVQLINNEGVVVSETVASAGEEVRLSGQATGGDRNMVRLIRDTPRSAPAPFAVRIRTIPEAN